MGSEACKEAYIGDIAHPLAHPLDKNIGVSSMCMQGECGNSTPVELDMVSEGFSLQDSFTALQTRVGQMECKMESRLGGLESQLKMQQQEIVNISHKMDSIARV